MQDKSLLGMLFDLSFSEFVTTRIIKFLFIIGVAFAGLITFFMIIAGFSGGAGRGILALIVAPFLFLLYVLGVRIWCEIVIVVFRIAENTSRMVEQNKSLPEA